MKKNLNNHINAARKGKILMSPLILTMLFALCSCNEEDPSYEKEALKLTAENAALKARAEESDRQMQALQTQLNQAQSAVASSVEKVTEAKGQIDVEKIKMGFAKAVSGLGEQIEKKHPDSSVESVTFQKMKLPTDYPFSSGVMTTLVSKTTGKKRTLYWEAQGNTQGVWRFANKDKPANTVAQATPPASNPTPTPAATPKTPTAQPVARPRRPISRDGNAHIIDWGKL